MASYKVEVSYEVIGEAWIERDSVDDAIRAGEMLGSEPDMVRWTDDNPARTSTVRVEDEHGNVLWTPGQPVPD